MGEMEELAEHIEEAAHEGHEGHGGHGKGGKGGIGKYIGMTMAVLGVLLALCSALVGGARTELVTTMVEQNSTAQNYQAVSMKYRTLMAQLQQLHALLPSDPGEFKKTENEVIAIENQSVATKDAAAQIIHAMRIETGNVLNTVTPTGADVLRFVSLVRDYEKEREVAKKWTESYEDKVKAFEQGAEHYEWAQLCAEFGIVLASIALLLQSRAAWMLSLAMAVTSLGIIGWSYTTASASIGSAEREIEEAKHAYSSLNMEAAQTKGDEELLKDIERVEGSEGAGDHPMPPPVAQERASAEHHEGGAAPAHSH